MGVKTVDELAAYQLSEAFKREIYRLVRSFPTADRDLKFRDQLFEAASGPPSHIAEGFARNTPREFRRFLSYARGSLNEALVRLRDGVDRGHFGDGACVDAKLLGGRALKAVAGLQKSLAPFL